MKYLKSFNIEDDLMYLKDNGFDIDLKTCTEDNIPVSMVNKLKSIRKLSDCYILKINREQEFNWVDIKYDFIPFLELISKKYNIIYASYDRNSPLSRSVISIYDILDDKLLDFTIIKRIMIIFTDGITPEKSPISKRNT